MNEKIKTYTYKDLVKANKVMEKPDWYLPYNLNVLTKRHGISMSKMALYCGISKAYVSQLMAGNNKSPSIGTVMNLATFWEMTAEEICFRKIEN